MLLEIQVITGQLLRQQLESRKVKAEGNGIFCRRCRFAFFSSSFMHSAQKADKEVLFIEKEVCALAAMVTYAAIGTVQAN